MFCHIISLLFADAYLFFCKQYTAAKTISLDCSKLKQTSFKNGTPLPNPILFSQHIIRYMSTTIMDYQRWPNRIDNM